jgi:hypothetical protein
MLSTCIIIIIIIKATYTPIDLNCFSLQLHNLQEL